MDGTESTEPAGNYPSAFSLNQSSSITIVIHDGCAGVTTIIGPVTLTSASVIHIDRIPVY